MFIVDQFVAGELLKQKSIVRLVGVEGANHVVAIAPSKRSRQMLLAFSLAIGVAGHVEPMTPPTLAVARRRQEPLDQTLIGVGRGIGQKHLNLSRLRRKTGQIKCCATEQCQPVCLGRESQFTFIELLQYERVDRIADSIAMRSLWRSHGLRRPKRPEVSVGGTNQWIGSRASHVRFVERFRGAEFNPARELGNLVMLQRLDHYFDQAFVRWHFLCRDPLEHQAFSRLTRDNCRSVLAPLKHAGSSPQVEPRLLLMLSMTDRAAQEHDRDDVVLGDFARGCGRSAEGGPGVNPTANAGHLGLGQPLLLVRWHRSAAHLFVEGTIRRLPRHEDRPRLSSGADSFHGVQRQRSFLDGRAVASAALRVEEGLNHLFEICRGIIRTRRLRWREDNQESPKHAPEPTTIPPSVGACR